MQLQFKSVILPTVSTRPDGSSTMKAIPIYKDPVRRSRGVPGRGATTPRRAMANISNAKAKGSGGKSGAPFSKKTVRFDPSMGAGGANSVETQARELEHHNQKVAGAKPPDGPAEEDPVDDCLNASLSDSVEESVVPVAAAPAPAVAADATNPRQAAAAAAMARAAAAAAVREQAAPEPEAATQLDAADAVGAPPTPADTVGGASDEPAAPPPAQSPPHPSRAEEPPATPLPLHASAVPALQAQLKALAAETALSDQRLLQAHRERAEAQRQPPPPPPPPPLSAPAPALAAPVTHTEAQQPEGHQGAPLFSALDGAFGGGGGAAEARAQQAEAALEASQAALLSAERELQVRAGRLSSHSCRVGEL